MGRSPWAGCRRHDATAVIGLTRIKTLASVRELPRADPERFARAVDDIDAALAERIAALRACRERVRHLGSGERLVPPAKVVAYLARMCALNFSERVVDLERDGWILPAAQSPERIAGWMAERSRPS